MAKQVKSKTKQQIIDGKAALKQIMQRELGKVAVHFVDQLVKHFKNSTDRKVMDALKKAEALAGRDYNIALKSALAVISSDALKQIRKEIPIKAKVKLSWEGEGIKLGEFENLPPDIQERIKAKADLLVGTNIDDLVKALSFQYQSSADSTDSVDLLQKDLDTAAEDFITGSSIDAGAGVTSAETINSARAAFYTDDSVSEALDGLEFVNEDPVSPICQDLAGTVFAVDDPEAARYQPPLHWNCKSYISPILNGNLDGRDIEELKPSNPSLDKYVQFGECTCGAALHNFGERTESWVKIIRSGS